MVCPDCGYMMTAFDAECARCSRLGKPTKTAQRLEDDPLPATNEAVLEKPAQVSWDYGEPDIQPSRWSLKKLTVPTAALLTAIILVGFYFVNAWYQQVIATKSATETASKIKTLKQEGFVQCTAGDVEGCHYYIDKLRDQGDAADGEYLKARMIAAEYFNNTPGLAPMEEEFIKNKLTAQTLKSTAELAATEGNRPAMDACGFLGDRPSPPGFPPLPADIISAPSGIKTETVTVAPASPNPAPAYSMTTKAGGGAPPDTSAIK